MPIIASSQNTLRGKIVGQTGEPVGYVEIILQTLDSNFVKYELTDKKGFFKFTNVVNGTYELSVQYFSENIHSQIVNVKGNIDLETIIITASFTLDDIIVRGKINLKKEVGKYVLTNISSSKFAKNKNTYDFLNTIPMLETSADGSSLKIRNKGDAIILINGRSVGSNEIALSMIQSIAATSIKKIEIIKNPDSKYDAGSKNGIINIILKNKQNEGFKGSISSRIALSFYKSQNFDTYLSFSKNKWIITSGLKSENYHSKYKSNYIYYDFINDIETSININTRNIKKTFTPYLNVNYIINKKQTIGFQFNSRFSDFNSLSRTKSIFNKLNSTAVDSSSIARIENKIPNSQTLFSNINYNLKIDSIGSKLELSLTFYNNKNDKNSFNNFDYSNSNSNSFLQNPKIKTSVYNLKTDYSKIFNNKNKINIGASYTNSNIDNNFFFGNLNGLEYISDPQQSNKFKYNDYTLAAYVIYEKSINQQWQGKLGFRLEQFESEGKTKTMPKVNKISNTYLFPSLSVLYIPNDEHEFSLDLGSCIIRPSYNNLNPFIRYTSPTTFRISKPNLRPTLSYELYFNYTFFDDFSFDFDYVFDKDLFNDFDLVLSNSHIKTITDNWGSGSDYFFDLTYSKTFLEGKWNFSTSLSYNYNANTGDYKGVNLDYKNDKYFFRLKNNIILNKKQDMILSINYSYNSGNRSILGEMNALHSLTADLSKSFNNWNFSIGAYDLARSDLKLNERRKEYAFCKTIEYFKTYYLSIRYSFGKKKVKKVYDKQNDIQKRL